MGKFISWYRAPRDGAPVEYLAFMPPYDHGQFSAPEGEWFYTLKIDNAYRFDTIEDARAKTPVYDGSRDLEGRSGVIEVFVDKGDKLIAPPDPWMRPVLIAAFLIALYFAWQFAR